MASIRSVWSGLSLQAKIFTYSVALVILLVGAVLAFSYQRASRLARESLEQALATTRSLFENLEEERLEKLELVNSVVAESPIFKALVAERADAATWLDSARSMVQQVGSDFMIVTDAEGVLLTRTDVPGREGEDLSDTPLIRLALEGQVASGVWREGERLYHAVAVPLVTGPAIVGAVTSGYLIADDLARNIKRFAGCEVIFLAGTGPDATVAGSTLAERSRSVRDWLAAADPAGESADLSLELDGESYQAILTPLVTVGGEEVGLFAALRSRDRELAAFRTFQRSVLFVGLGVLGLAILASLVVSRGITRPIKRLVTLTDRIREGNYESTVEIASGDEIGSLAASFRALVGELREKSLMEKYISRSAAEMIQSTRAVPAVSGERQPVTVLFSDLRAFAGRKTDAPPDQVLSRVNRALARQAELVERYGGQVDKFIGDRMMAVFKGAEMTWPAVRCANAVQQYLDGEHEEEPLLPSIGLSTGEAVFGSVGTRDRLDYTLLGTTVRVAARLCDEASPGEILLSEDAYERVAERVSAERLSPLRIQGLEAPLAVFLVSGGTVRQRTPAAAASLPGTTVATAETATTLLAPARSSAPAAIGPGSILGGRYEIRQVLGSGGMGMVFQALDRELDDLVAVKLLRPDIVAMDPTIVERFKGEIRVARRITHRNVVRTFSFEDLEGVKFITMEYVQGITLKQVIRKKGALPLGVGLRIAKQTCAGLAAAHEQGVVHRDVKPQNIILTPASEVKIMDFGIARPVDMRGVTATGLVVGTPEYMSPEQAQGKQDLDQRSDIYAAGVVFFEMFTGVLPFQADSAIAIALKHVQERPPAPSSLNPRLPPALAAVILRCLEKDPARRYPQMSALQSELWKLSTGS